MALGIRLHKIEHHHEHIQPNERSNGNLCSIKELPVKGHGLDGLGCLPCVLEVNPQVGALWQRVGVKVAKAHQAGES